MRYPVVAGQFYPSDAKELQAMLKGYFESASVNEKGVKAIVSPHAGYVYSGPVAACSYKALKQSHEKPPKIVILGPNHTGAGSFLAVSVDDWETPLGLAECDIELAKRIIKESGMVEADENAHRFEHSIEVQLPFLHHIYGKKIRFVAICMAMHDPETAEEMGKAIARASKEAVVIASSDFTHYEKAEAAKAKDEKAIEFIKKLDVDGFFESTQRTGASICGPGPIMTAMSYAKEAGAKQAKLLKLANSGDVTGDYGAVVDYAAIVME